MPCSLRPAAACLALAALAAACSTDQRAAAPQPMAIRPPLGTGLEPLAVEISGQRFGAQVRTDFAGDGGAVAAAFAAVLAPQGGGSPVPLEDVALTPARTLRATVPAGLAHGSYDLAVTDPAGRTGILRGAFRVVTSAESVASFRVDVLEPPRAGVAFAISLTAIDPAGGVVDGFDGSVAVEDETGTAAPSSLGPFVLGRFQGQVTVGALHASDRLTVRDALGHEGRSEPFDVVAGPAVAVGFRSAPVVAARGACSPAVEVELQDGLGQAATAGAPVPALLQSAPPGVAFFSDAACTAPISGLTFAPGAAGAAFHFVSAAGGAIALRVVPATVPSAVQAASVTP